MHLNLPTSVLWAVETAAMVVIIILMLRRGLHREYRVFFFYMIYEVLLTLSLFMLRGSYAAYFYAYWTGEALEVVLAFAVIYEVFGLLLRPYPAVRRVAVVLLAWAAVLLVGIAIVLAMMPHGEKYRLMSLLFAAERTVAVLQSGLLIFLFLFAASLGITWRHHLFGIAMGFGLLGVTTLAASAIRVQVGYDAAAVFHWIKMGSYLSALFLWAGYFLTTEPSTLRSPALPGETSLQRWDEALMQVMQQ
jgi:hypothetical protein